MMKGMSMMASKAADRAMNALTEEYNKAVADVKDEERRIAEARDNANKPQATLMMVVVPDGVAQGAVFQVQTTDGRVLQVTCPPGVSGGQTIQIQVPPAVPEAPQQAPVVPQAGAIAESKAPGNAFDRYADQVQQVFDSALGRDDDKVDPSRAPIPAGYDGPAGLAGLAGAFPKVYLDQKVEAAEVASSVLSGYAAANLGMSLPSFEGANKYRVKDVAGNVMLHVDEVPGGNCDMLLRNTCRREAPLRITVASTHTGRQVLEMRSGWACDQSYACCLVPVCCCLRKLDVRVNDGSVPPGEGELLGSVEEQCTANTCCCCAKQFHSYDAERNQRHLFYLEGFLETLTKCLSCDCSCDISQFSIFAPGADTGADTPRGRVYFKRFGGYEPTNERYVEPIDPADCAEFKSMGEAMSVLGKALATTVVEGAKEHVKQSYTDADSYLIELPEDDVTNKSLVLAAALLNDYLFNENGGRRNPEGAPVNQEIAR